MTIGFYVHHRKNGVPFYVGKGTELRSRLFSRRNQFHKNIVAKDGRENIKITFTACASEEEAFHKEIALIALYRAIGIELVNATDGGEGPSNPTAEVRKKISEARKRLWSDPVKRKEIMLAANNEAQKAAAVKMGKANKGKKLSALHRARISENSARKGKPNWNSGKKLSAETREKMKQAKKAMWQNPEYRKKVIAATTGSKRSTETKAKMRAAWLLRRNRK